MINYFKLYQSTKMIMGFNRLLFIDTQYQNFFLAPKSIFYILEKFSSKSIQEILVSFETEDEKKIVNDYFDWMIKNNIGFIVNDKEILECFSIVNETFETPYDISNMIIEINDFTFDNLVLITNFLIKYRVPYIELRFYYYISYEQINIILNSLNETFLEEINIIIPIDSIEIKLLEAIILNNPRIKFFTIFNSKEEYSKDFFKGESKMIFTKTNINSNSHCGKISKDYFVLNQLMYAESQQNNTCLNRKISIDKNGFIRNCPSMPQHFGNINDTTLEEALNHPDFKKYWNVTKDMIAVCKDCEFRHICTDCRAYTERTHFEDDIDLSKPLKCGYNPYTNEWAEWSTNPLKEKAIEYYGMQDLVKKDA
jgi:SPASM domain peptide maturase of grasp-with-spasm system